MTTCGWNLKMMIGMKVTKKEFDKVIIKHVWKFTLFFFLNVIMIVVYEHTPTIFNRILQTVHILALLVMIYAGVTLGKLILRIRDQENGKEV